MKNINSLPKIIHYCWFGRNPLPAMAIRCIKSWRTFFPDYEIWEWNEDGIAPSSNSCADRYMSFNTNVIQYTQEAYSARKYAFVSDYARFWVLYKFGGLYFDTDVEVIRNMDHIIARGSFMGFEQPSEEIKNSMNPLYKVAPGLGLGVNPGLDLYKELLDYYAKLHFLDEEGKPNPITIVKHTTEVLISKGLMQNNKLQQVAGVWIYPWDVFCPQSFYTNKISMSEATVSIHLYSDSWHSPYENFKKKIDRLLGPRISSYIVKLKHLILLK